MLLLHFVPTKVSSSRQGVGFMSSRFKSFQQAGLSEPRSTVSSIPVSCVIPNLVVPILQFYLTKELEDVRLWAVLLPLQLANHPLLQPKLCKVLKACILLEENLTEFEIIS